MGKIIPSIIKRLSRAFGKREVINEAENIVMVEAGDGVIRIICHTDKQMDRVVKRMTEPGNCVLDGVERWSEDQDEHEQFILTFKLVDEFDSPVIYN